MSVVTTADERIASAIKHLADAYADLLAVLDENTYGHDEFKPGYIRQVHEVVMRIHELKTSL